MRDVASYLPDQVNSGWLLTAYTFERLKKLIAGRRLVLPVCSLGTPVDELVQLGPLVPKDHQDTAGHPSGRWDRNWKIVSRPGSRPQARNKERNWY